MSDFERAHAESIADPAPDLRVLPSERTTTIVVGTSVRKPMDVLQAHLSTLDHQVLPPRVTVRYAFVPDYPNPNDPALAHLAAWAAERDGVLLQGADTRADDFTDADAVTHRWTTSAMGRVGENKNRILRYALQSQADAVFLVDADLLLDRRVLWNLYYAKVPLVSAVYWTRWHAGGEQVIHAAPQVWLGGVYEPFQSGQPCRGKTVQEFRDELVRKEFTSVWGLGACTLIQRHVIEKGVGFHRNPLLPTGGLWDGEDRHFCAWAAQLHVPAAADPWSDIFHVYHPTDAARIPAMLARFRQGEAERPAFGDWVNVRLAAIEEPNAGARLVRCRMGDGTLMPDIEAALYPMRRGDAAIVPVQFPIHYPLEKYRGAQRLMDVTLVDHKPMGYPPVLEDELYAAGGWAVKDATTLSAAQHAALAGA